MRPLNWLRALTLILTTTVLAAVAAACLPDNPYQRFALLENTIQARIRWIYERSHDDPTPIDIAVLGSSRWGAAVDARRLNAELAARGLPLTTVNFALPEAGRDLHWVIMQQMIERKHPKLIIIGVNEKPSRFGHPAYKYVAPAGDVVDPAYFGNLNYLSNLIYLPYRQIKLFAASLFPDYFGLPTRFDPAHYTGSNNENAFAFRNDDGTAIQRDRQLDRVVLDAQVRRYEAGVDPPIFGRDFADIEFGDERAYVTRIATAAKVRGIGVAFLFLPYYSGPTDMQERDLYARFGPILDASFLADHGELYADVAHVNHAGEAVLTDWLAPRIAALLGDRPPVAPVPGISAGHAGPS